METMREPSAGGAGGGEMLEGRRAEDLFPDFFPKAKPDPPEREVQAVLPPEDTGWSENDDDRRTQEDTGLYALLLLQKEQRPLVERTLARMGYAVSAAQSAEQALEELRTGRHQLIFCGTDGACAPLHHYICRQMPQSRRRILYYVLIGPDVHTCYDLQALALSANLVVNERELAHLDRILRRGFQDYAKLFLPFLEVLGETRTPLPPQEEGDWESPAS